MQRIFAVLAVLNNILLIVAFVLGWQIGDPGEADRVVQAGVNTHFLVALSGLVFAMFVHAIMLTYFMGTGRWMEDTSEAYKLPEEYRNENQSLKYRTLPWMVLCVTLLIFVAASGGGADPASPVSFAANIGMEEATLHLWLAGILVGLNIVINFVEFRAISRNRDVITNILDDVRRIRLERGLPV